MPLVELVKRDPATAPISDKLKALLAIAARVQQSGSAVTEDDVAVAREHGATDVEIHDTVLIAAAFCMFNPLRRRACDRLTPTDPQAYDEMAARMVAHAYAPPFPTRP